VIVRLMGEGQYRVSDDLGDRLNELDDRAAAALEANDEIELDNRLDEMWELVRHEGEKLADDDLSTSDAVIPPSDLTLEESRQLMSHEGFIPDVPVSG
jgi:chromosome condensin MukBEF complex kleisin-like MukF subunit